MLRHHAGGHLLSGDAPQRYDAQERDVDEQVDSHHRDDAAEHRPRDVAARVFHLFRKVDDGRPSVVRVDDGLQREDEGDGDRAFALRDDRRRGRMPSAEVEAGGDEEQKRQRLQQTRGVLRPPSPAHAEPLNQCKDGDDRERDRLDAAQCGKEHERVLGDDDGDGGGRAAGGNPVAPADHESGVVAEGAANEDVLPARFRHERSELRQRIRAEERVETAGDPDAEERPEGGELRRDVAGRAQDAGADHVAERYGKAERHAEDGEQFRARQERKCSGRGKRYRRPSQIRERNAGGPTCPNQTRRSLHRSRLPSNSCVVTSTISCLSMTNTCAKKSCTTGCSLSFINFARPFWRAKTRRWIRTRSAPSSSRCAAYTRARRSWNGCKRGRADTPATSKRSST